MAALASFREPRCPCRCLGLSARLPTDCLQFTTGRCGSDTVAHSVPSASTSTTTRRRRTAQSADTRQVVTQITQLVAANESQKIENAKLQALNEQLRGELTAIGSALTSWSR